MDKDIKIRPDSGDAVGGIKKGEVTMVDEVTMGRPHLMIKADNVKTIKIGGEDDVVWDEEMEKELDGFLEAEDYEVDEEEEVMEEPEHIPVQYDITRGGPKLITNIRRFVAVKEIIANVNGYYGRVPYLIGDILEERFDKPNTFWNVSYMERENVNILRYGEEKQLYNINYNNTNVNHACCDAFEPIDIIDVKETFMFNHGGKKLARTYKSKLRKLAILNEELTNMRHMLDIELDED